MNLPLFTFGIGGEIITPKSPLRPFTEILSELYFLSHSRAQSITSAFTIRLGLKIR